MMEAILRVERYKKAKDLKGDEGYGACGDPACNCIKDIKEKDVCEAECKHNGKHINISIGEEEMDDGRKVRTLICEHCGFLWVEIEDEYGMY